MERFQRLYELPKNLYVNDTPIMISAGALTKDNNTGKIFIQLKIKNISEKVIKAVFVKIIGYDVTKTKVDDIIKYEYLDLNCDFGKEFGSKTPIYLTDPGIRYFLIRRIKVIFSDDSIDNIDYANVKALPKRQLLEDKYDDDQIYQFKNCFGTECRFLPQKYDDLFLCTCGGINKSCNCKICGQNIMDMLAVNPDELKKEGIYNKAMQHFESGGKSEFAEAVNLFNSIIDWKDSREKIDECNTKIKEINVTVEKVKNRNKKITVIGGPFVAALIVFLIVLNKVILPASNYKKAITAADSGNYAEAYSRFEKNPDYKDSESKINEYKLFNIKNILPKSKVGDIIVFGSYEQDNNVSNGKEEIEWRVLAKEGSKFLLISEYALDCQQYNTEDTLVTWETCTLRKWLNSTFYETAFRNIEKKMIKSTKVTAYSNPDYSTYPGNDTVDKVFLLSIEESDYYFNSSHSRICRASKYAINNGAWTTDNGICYWWLRTPGMNSYRASGIYASGSIDYSGEYKHDVDCSVRPALWIEI